MKKTIIIVAVLLICAYSQITIKNYGLCLAFVAAAVIVFLLGWKKRPGKKSTPQQSSQPAPSPAPAAPQPTLTVSRRSTAGTYRFKISGVTFEGRQDILKKIDDMDDEKYMACSYGINQTEYKGSPAVQVYVQLSDDNMTEKVLGYVPSEDVNDVLKIIDRVFDVDVEVYGGQDDKYYGAAATLYFDR